MTITDPRPNPTRRPPGTGTGPPWRGAVVLLAAVLWVYALGSIAAIVLAVAWRHAVTSPTDRTLLRIGAALGAIGLAATLASWALLAGGSPS